MKRSFYYMARGRASKKVEIHAKIARRRPNRQSVNLQHFSGTSYSKQKAHTLIGRAKNPTTIELFLACCESVQLFGFSNGFALVFVCVRGVTSKIDHFGSGFFFALLLLVNFGNILISQLAERS